MAMLPVQAPEQEAVREIRPRLTGSSSRGLAGRSDERLVSIAKDGDERAFEVLYERHSPAILRYCRSLLRSTQEAEDVKQEVFVLAISALRRGAEPDSFRPWLYRVAHNACMSHLRIRRPVLVADNGVLVGPVAAAEPVQHREELRQLLDDIGTLPDVQRGALLLREMDGFSYEQVGEVLGLPLSTVRATIFRARRTLQGLAEARDADCEAIQSELSYLADRRGRRGRHITSHLTVCSNCRDFRDGLRRRATVLGGIAPAGPLGPGGLLLALKGKLLGGATAGGGAGTAIATGAGGGAAKIAAVAMSSIALLAGAGVEADHVIDHSRREAAVTPRHAVAASATRAAATPSGRASVRWGATGTTAAADGVREGVGVTAGPASPAEAPSRARARAHARVKHRAAAATPAADTPGTPRAIAPESAAAGDTVGTAAGDSHHADGEASGTSGRERDHRSSRGEDSDGAEPKGSGSTRSGSTGSGHDDSAEESAPRTESHESDSSNRSGTPERRDDAPRTPTPSRSEGAGTPPVRPPAGDDDATPGTSESSGTPTPAPDPAPAPEAPADQAPDPDAPAEPPVDSPTVAASAADAAGTPDAGAADPAAGSTLPPA